MKFKRIICLSLLAALSWLTTYQICDASEDAAETISACAQIASRPGFFLSAPQAPDDDADAQIPSVVSQALTLSSIVTNLSCTTALLPGRFGQTPAAGWTAPSLSMSLSPPGRSVIVPSGAFGHPREPFTPTSRTLAPPAA